ncbi:reverse transcriptase domain-containing protein [Tanacetum coccineum]
MEDQLRLVDASPIALSPGYIADFDPEEDEDDLEEDPADYPADGGDNDNNESSDDDDDDDDVKKDKEDEEEEEHLAPADPSVVPTDDFTERQEDKVAENTSNKRKWEGNHNGSSSQQNKGHKVPRAYITWPINKKAYAESLPLCNQCSSIVKQDCRNPAAARNQRTLTCYECENLGHYKGDCPELKNQNHGNQDEGIGARGLVHALGGGKADQDLNDMEDDISA